MIAKEQVAALKRQKECDKYCQQVGKWRNVGDSKFISDVIKISFLSVYCIRRTSVPDSGWIDHKKEGINCDRLDRYDRTVFCIFVVSF
jgi:hypothetical protein